MRAEEALRFRRPACAQPVAAAGAGRGHLPTMRDSARSRTAPARPATDSFAVGRLACDWLNAARRMSESFNTSRLRSAWKRRALACRAACQRVSSRAGISCVPRLPRCAGHAGVAEYRSSVSPSRAELGGRTLTDVASWRHRPPHGGSRFAAARRRRRSPRCRAATSVSTASTTLDSERTNRPRTLVQHQREVMAQRGWSRYGGRPGAVLDRREAVTLAPAGEVEDRWSCCLACSPRGLSGSAGPAFAGQRTCPARFSRR
jgi:hypothetical protein